MPRQIVEPGFGFGVEDARIADDRHAFGLEQWRRMQGHHPRFECAPVDELGLVAGFTEPRAGTQRGTGSLDVDQLAAVDDALDQYFGAQLGRQLDHRSQHGCATPGRPDSRQAGSQQQQAVDGRTVMHRGEGVTPGAVAHGDVHTHLAHAVQRGDRRGGRNAHPQARRLDGRVGERGCHLVDDRRRRRWGDDEPARPSVPLVGFLEQRQRGTDHVVVEDRIELPAHHRTCAEVQHRRADPPARCRSRIVENTLHRPRANTTARRNLGSNARYRTRF